MFGDWGRNMFDGSAGYDEMEGHTGVPDADGNYHSEGAQDIFIISGPAKSDPVFASDKIVFFESGIDQTKPSHNWCTANSSGIAADFSGDGTIDWFIVLQTNTSGVIVDSDLIF